MPSPAERFKAGREQFVKKEYAAALASFETLLAEQPGSREARFLAGLSAYWARKPKQALEHFNRLLDGTPRNSAEEWRLECARVMTLAALGEHDAAELTADRLRQLAPRLPATTGSTAGFTREHFYLRIGPDEQSAKRYRIGAWEVLDRGGEVQDLWTFPVVELDGANERVAWTLRVESAPLPSGGAGYVFSDDKDGKRAEYQRWVQRPEYAEVRVLAKEILTGQRAPLAATAGPAASMSTGTPDVPKPAAPAPNAPRVFTQKEMAATARVGSWGLNETTTQILTVAARLRDVRFDVTRLSRFSLQEPAAAAKLVDELRREHPFAPEDAGELVDLIRQAKTEHVNAASENLPKLGSRGPYLDYALLTAFNTRGKDVPVFFLRDCLKSTDAMVRQTAALLLGRIGERGALELLFRELTDADHAGCAITAGSIEELLGPVLGTPPTTGAEPLKAWKDKAAEWWKANGERIQFQPQAPLGQPLWK